MEMLEAVKIILEIIVIFITFPQYAPILAAIAFLGAMSYYLLRDEEKNDREYKPASKHIPVADIPPEVKQ